MFNFPKVSVEELNKPVERTVFPKGIYPFVIVTAQVKVALKSGNEMLSIMIKVSSEHGKSVNIFDNLVNLESMAWKHHHLCKSIGQEDLYTQGAVNPKGLEGCGGMVEIIIEDDQKYGKRNKVKDYVCAEDQLNPGVEPTLNDDIPF